MSQDKISITYVHVENLHEFEGNPQEQSKATFHNLVQEIDQDGFDEPLQVIPDNEHGKGHYRIVSGNHRYRAAKLLDYEELPVVVREWDALTSKIKLVRRNRLKGELNSHRFTKLVNEIANEENLDLDVLQEMMAFRDIDEFMKFYKTDQQQQDASAARFQHQEENKPQLKVVDNLSFHLNRLFTEYGDTVPYNFMFFDYGSRIHLMVQMNSQMKRTVNYLTRLSVKHGVDFNKLLASVMGAGADQLNLSLDEPPDMNELEQYSDEDEDEDDVELEAVVPQ
jgi:hypothetical protein